MKNLWKMNLLCQIQVHRQNRCGRMSAKTCFSSRSTQKCFTPTLEENTKNMLHRFPPNKCSKFLLLSLKSLLQKKGMSYEKVIHKKEEEREKKKEELKKWISFLVIVSKFKMRDMLLRSIVESG